jgi:hypothetical protein
LPEFAESASGAWSEQLAAVTDFAVAIPVNRQKSAAFTQYRKTVQITVRCKVKHESFAHQ